MAVRGPRSMYDNALQSVHMLVENACKNINDCYGDFRYERVKVEVKELKKYIHSFLPNRVLDDLCTKRKHGNFSVQETLDLRIHLDVYFHSNIEKFIVHSRFISKGRFRSFWCEVPIQEPLWVEKFSLATKLTFLDLKEVCTDEVLAAVGNTCFQLQEIHMSYPPPREVMDRRQPNRQLLTDTGMRCLVNCKKLRKIIRTENPYSTCKESLKELIQSLPKLEFITCSFIGALLNEMNVAKGLTLTSVEDKDCEASFVQAITKSCPGLQSLSLSMKVSFSEAASFQRAHKVMEVLQDDDLNLQTLKLENFTFDQFTINFLRMKGSYLHTFCMTGPTLFLLNYQDVANIGHHCPNIRKLVLNDLYHNFDENFSNFKSSFSRRNLFSKLEWLGLFGRDWDPDILLPVCLENTQSLKYLALGNQTNISPLWLDDLFEDLFFAGKFTKLQTLHLHSGLIVSMTTLNWILRSCCGMTDMVVLESSNWTKEEVTCLRKEARQISTDTILRFYL